MDGEWEGEGIRHGAGLDGAHMGVHQQRWVKVCELRMEADAILTLAQGV